MGLFDVFKKKEEKSNYTFYEGEIKTNANFGNTIDGLNRSFLFLSKKVNSPQELEDVSNTTINGVAHLFASEDIANSILKEVNNRFDNKYTVYNSNVSLFFDDIVAGKIDGIAIYGIIPNNKVAILDKESAGDLKDLLTIYHAMCQIKNGIISKEEGYSRIKDVNVYFAMNKELLQYVDSNGNIEIPAGTKFTVRGNPNYITLYYDTIKYGNNSNQEQEGVRAFANEYSALKYGVPKEDLCSMPLWELKEKSNLPVVLEPHRNWWVAF